VPYTHYDRLTALDTSFLDLETDSVHMHVGSVGIFSPGPLANTDGGIDFDAICDLAEAGLRRAPRFRQKLARVPVSGHPVWVDDESFNLLYHVRHTSLPVPGDARTLKRLVGRIMSQNLDRAKPLWELWFVEELKGGRFAVISKVHHCLIDGISGVDLLSAFMGPDEDYRADDAHGHRWIPRPPPGRIEMLGDELLRRASLPLRAARGALRALRQPGDAVDAAVHSATGFAEAAAGQLSSASETPFNVEIGPHRRIDWTRFDLDIVREVKRKLGGTVNDVVLACVTGAVRAYLGEHETSLEEIDFRTFIPVNTRGEREHGKLGNRVSLLVAHLPVAESDPRRRMELVVEETSRLKQSDQVAGASMLEEVSDWTATALLTRFSRLAASRRSYNLIVTNVPGPPNPVYMSGARLLACYPLVPLFSNQALGIALFSHDGSLYWGFNADWDAIPDLHDFVTLVESEFEALRKL
jgi:WS/DGAT/MGAT family acyltransferase